MTRLDPVEREELNVKVQVRDPKAPISLYLNDKLINDSDEEHRLTKIAVENGKLTLSYAYVCKLGFDRGGIID